MNMSTAEAASNFWMRFKQERQRMAIQVYLIVEIQLKLASMNSGPKSTVTTDLESVLNRINLLEKKVNAATVYLPPYDLRQCLLQLKELQDELLKKRKECTPRAKFSFKSSTTSLSAPSPICQQFVQNEEKSKWMSNRLLNPKAVHVDTSPNSISFKAEQDSIFRPESDDNSPQDVHLMDLKHCVIDLSRISLSSMHVYNVQHCVILAKVFKGSIMIQQLEDCVLIVGCQQFRMHHSYRIQVYLYSMSHPIIEDCNNITFGEYPHCILSLCGVDATINCYDKVEDFKWLRRQASPHWQLLPPEKVKEDTEWSSILQSIQTQENPDVNVLLAKLH